MYFIDANAYLMSQVEDWKDGKLVSVEEVTESEEEAAADAEDGEWDEDEQVGTYIDPRCCMAWSSCQL